MRLSNHLLSLGIENQVDKVELEYEVWVFDQDKLGQARLELDKFLVNPKAKEFAKAEQIAAQIIKQKNKDHKRSSQLYVDVRTRGANLFGNQVTWMLMSISVMLYMLKTLADNEAVQIFFFNLLIDLPIPGAPFLWKVSEGQVWRLVTPIFLHFGFMHILFNMMWLFTLGTQIEEKKGRAKFLVIVVAIAINSNLAQYIYAGPSFGGMSGVVFGLMGYVWMKMKFQPLEGIAIDPQNINFMLIWLVLCMTGLVGPIANACHLIGLLTGIFLGYYPVLLNRVKRLK